MNAKQRYNAKRAAKNRERKAYVRKIERACKQCREGCSRNVAKAVTITGWCIRPATEVINMENPQYRKVCNEAGRQIYAVQKKRGESRSLI